MVYQNLSLIAGFLLLYSLFAGRFESRLVSGPLMFLMVGYALGPGILNILHMQINGEGMRLLVEITLAIVLFTDAANANLAVLKTYNCIPLRLLLIGLPLCQLAGWLFGLWLFPNMHWLEVAILATILAPTDAALGKAVVSNPQVPAPVRESLNVESGLNDGICVPVLLFLLALIAPEEMHQGTIGTAVWLFIEEIGLGLLVGITLAYATAGLLRITIARRWSLPIWRQLMLPGLAVLCFALAQWLGGSGFIAAFVGGLFMGHLLPKEKEHDLEANEEFGGLLSVIVWLVFGSVVIVKAWPYFTWHVWAYALASLTVLRMLPVWLSLMKTTVTGEQRLFIGWFGPRGLASIVFMLIVMPYNLSAGQQINATIIATILLSVVLHGLTANPWVARFKQVQ